MSKSDYWSKFYWVEWQSDPALKMTSKASKGVWIDLLCFLFGCDQAGRATVNGHTLTLDELARAIDGDHAENRECVDELIRRGVLRQDDDGVFYSKRMDAERELREARASAGRAGGLTTAAKRQAKPKQTRQQDSSSSSSSKPESKIEQFEAFWSAYPKCARKVGKVQCRKHWASNDLDAEADAILAGLEQWKACKQWTKDDGDFIPLVKTFLNNRYWEAEAKPDKAGQSKAKAQAWDALGPDVHRELLEAVKLADPSTHHTIGNMDTERAMRKLAKERGLI